MRTLFEKLNESYGKLRWTDIAKYMPDRTLKKIISGFPNYFNTESPKLKIFYKNNYKSPIITKLKKEGIFIKEGENSEHIEPLKNIYDIKESFRIYLHDYLYKSISDTLDYSKFKEFDNDEIDSAIIYYIYDDLISLFSLYSLNQDDWNNDYILCMINNNEEYFYNFIYDTQNRNNSFGIINGDPVIKEHLIEYAKEMSGIYGNKVQIYSGYFDNL